MQLEIRRAALDDRHAIMNIIEQARRALRAQGINQWQDGYPATGDITADIEMGHSWLALADGHPAATAALVPGPERDYAVIKGGWHTPETYCVLHRIALADTARGSGIAGRLLAYLIQAMSLTGYKAIRSDTHADNRRMQRFLQKNGFTFCGTVYLASGAARLAYDRNLSCQNYS